MTIKVGMRVRDIRESYPGEMTVVGLTTQDGKDIAIVTGVKRRTIASVKYHVEAGQHKGLT